LPARRDVFWVPRNTSDSSAGLFEMSKQTAADVPSCASEQNVGFHMTYVLVFKRFTLQTLGRYFSS
jgi:hypothetical protein